MELAFWKMESVGNDFVLVHLDDVEAARGTRPLDDFLAQLSIEACDRHTGIGSDGLLVATPGISLRMFNPDGTEDFCGNGIRCAIAHAISQDWLRRSSAFRIEHFGQCLDGSIDGKGDFHYMLGPASYDPAVVPHAGASELFDAELFEIGGRTFRGSVLSTGTAHTILPVLELPGDEEFYQFSPQIENHPLFPERTSVMWVKEDAPDRLRLRVWERGAGETMGCGSGSAAAAVDYLRRREGGVARIQVINPGGVLEFAFTGWDASFGSFGPVRETFKGRLTLSKPN